MEVNLLITGGAGFIGCALSQALIESAPAGVRPRIAVMDNLHPQVHPGRQRPSALPDAVDFYQSDICDEAAWTELLAKVKPRQIVHLAAETGTGQSFELPVRHTHVNVSGTAQMIASLAKARHRPEQIVLASSRAVYGEGAWIDPADGRIFLPPSRSTDALRKGHFGFLAPSGREAVAAPHRAGVTTPAPVSIYGATKLAQEHILQAWCSEMGVRLSILRMQNVYGVGQSPHNPYTGIVGLFHRQAAAGKAIELYEDGEIGRDFIYIDDVIAAFSKVLESAECAPALMDVGSGEVTTIRQAASQIAQLYAAPDPVVTGAFRPGDIRYAVSDATMLRAFTGQATPIGFAAGSERLSAWLQDIGIIPSQAQRLAQFSR